jgi:hypothetical protein
MLGKITRYIGGILCWWKGKHLRGRPVPSANGKRKFACPRCGRETAYSVKAVS